jgi:hypothetical protein
MTPPAVTRVRARLWEPKRHARTPVAEAPADPSAEFADYVRGRIDGPVLRYAARLALIKEAGRRGIGRFEANLVIASVLHRAGMSQEYELRPKSAGWAGAVMTFAIVQAAVIAGAWWVLR